MIMRRLFLVLMIIRISLMKPDTVMIMMTTHHDEDKCDEDVGHNNAHDMNTMRI